MTLWYLSFVGDDSVFLGATVVAADSGIGAVAEAWRLGVNPGGEVMFCAVPKDCETAPDIVALRNKLLGAEQLFAMGAKRIGDIN